MASKGHVLDGMVDMVFGEIDRPSDGTDWKTAMRQRATSVRAALTRHPWAISTRSCDTAAPRCGCCRTAGFSVEMAAHAFSLLDSYIYGFVLQEVNLPFDDAYALDEVVESIMPQLSGDGYPHLVEADHGTRPPTGIQARRRVRVRPGPDPRRPRDSRARLNNSAGSAHEGGCEETERRPCRARNRSW